MKHFRSFEYTRTFEYITGPYITIFEMLERSLDVGEVVEFNVIRGLDGRTEILTLEVFSNSKDQREVRRLMQIIKRSSNPGPLYVPETANETLQKMKPRLGFRVVELPDSGAAGVGVTQVAKGGAGYRAGIVDDDVIMSIGGVELNSSEDLVEYMKNHSAGEWLPLQLESDDDIRWIELGSAGETVEMVRSLRLMAGHPDPSDPNFKKPGYNEKDRVAPGQNVDGEKVSTGPATESTPLAEARIALDNLKPSLGFTFSTSEGARIDSIRQKVTSLFFIAPSGRATQLSCLKYYFSIPYIMFVAPCGEILLPSN